MAFLLRNISYSADGRQFFLPTALFERWFAGLRPALVVTTSSPRSEQAAIRAAGKLRVEGKTYVFQEGDIANFLFNV